MRFDTRGRLTLLSGKLGGPRLLLADLGPAVGVAPASTRPRQGGKVLPNRSLDLASLREMDAEGNWHVFWRMLPRRLNDGRNEPTLQPSVP